MEGSAVFVETNMAKGPPEMADVVTKDAEKFTEGSRMSSVAEASALLDELAAPMPPSRKEAFNRMAERVSRYARFPLSPGRAEDLWRREARIVRAEEMDALRLARRRHEEAKAREEASRLATVYAGIASRLRATDPEFHRPEIDRLEHAASALGALDRAVDREG